MIETIHKLNGCLSCLKVFKLINNLDTNYSKTKYSSSNRFLGLRIIKGKIDIVFSYCQTAYLNLAIKLTFNQISIPI